MKTLCGNGCNCSDFLWEQEGTCQTFLERGWNSLDFLGEQSGIVRLSVGKYVVGPIGQIFCVSRLNFCRISWK